MAGLCVCGHGALLDVVVLEGLCDDASTVGAHTANVLLEGQMSGPRALAALISSMKATKSIDGRFRVNVRVEFRVGIELAANGIASQLYDDLVDVEDVSSLGRRRLEGALRDALHREGEHLAYVHEGREDEGDWVELVDAVRRRLIEVGLFPAGS
jgi:hypothetical protein